MGRFQELSSRRIAYPTTEHHDNSRSLHHCNMAFVKVAEGFKEENFVTGYVPGGEAMNLDNGIGFYRFAYNGSDQVYVGVMAQEVEAVRPDAVMRGDDGYLRVFYGRLGLRMQTYDDWLAAGGMLPQEAIGP